MTQSIPRCMTEPPVLDDHLPPQPIAPRTALLINPFYPKDPRCSFGKHVLTPSLALTSFAAATPPDWQVEIWDENLLQGPPPGARRGARIPAVVAITVHLTFANRAYALARWYRARGAIVIMGGLHTLSCPDEVAPHCDAMALGDGVQTWPQILHDVAAGKLQRIYRAGFLQPYRDDPAPRRDLLPRSGFLTTASLIATRGCHNRCGFFYLSTNGLTMPYQTRRVSQVVAEFAATQEPYGVFTDNNLGSKPAYLRELCAALRPLKKIWSAAVTIDVTDDPSLLRAMALAGCTGVFIGLETLTDQNLTDARKKTPRTDDYARRIRLLHDVGIQVNGSFVLGFDHDTPDVFARTADWIERHRLESATFHILTPYPGTPLFAQFAREGRILHRDWSQYDTAHVVFQPRRMTVQQLEEGYSWIYKRQYSFASIWQRRPEEVAAIPPYLAMAYLYKRCNWLWPFLIRHRLVHRMWHPLVELSRRRHVYFRRRFERQLLEGKPPTDHAPRPIVAAGV